MPTWWQSAAVGHGSAWICSRFARLGDHSWRRPAGPDARWRGPRRCALVNHNRQEHGALPMRRERYSHEPGSGKVPLPHRTHETEIRNGIAAPPPGDHFAAKQAVGLAELTRLAARADRRGSARHRVSAMATSARPDLRLVEPRDPARTPTNASALNVLTSQVGNAARSAGRTAGRHAARRSSRVRLHKRLAYALLLGLGLAFAVRFAVFWFNPARLPRDFSGGFAIANLALFAGLTFVVWHRQAMDILSWLICRRVEAHRDAPPLRSGMRVAFITTFVPGSESIEMLGVTLTSMLAADYSHDTWVLDEGNDAAVRSLCEQLGVRHFSRHGLPKYHQERGVFLTKSKAGNHNAWYDIHAGSYDVVAQIDSDFKVRKDFLTKTLGHFNNPRVAFVGTPQIYGNTGNLIARGAAQQTYLFYGPIMRALSHRRMTLLIGANHVVRVAALRDVGLYQGHLTEDLATGIRFHAAGWESVYVPEPLAVGEGPSNWTDYFNQQYRWAFGCMNIFFTHIPRMCVKMRRSHGLLYFLLAQFYFSGLAMITAVALLSLYYLFGWTPARIQLEQLAAWYGPLLVWRQLIPLWLQQFNIRPREERGFYWAGRMLTISVIPIYFLALVGVLRNKRVTFKTTPKGTTDAMHDGTRLTAFRPHVAIAVVIAGGMAIGCEAGHTSVIFLAWGVATASLLGSFFAAVLTRRAVVGLRQIAARLGSGRVPVLAVPQQSAQES
jgi:cellulose synthase (UDP-forming)